MSLARYVAKLAALLGADGKVPTNGISDLAITTAKMADGAITSSKIADGAVSTNDLADGAVTAAKIASGAIPPSNDASALTTGTLPIARIADGAVSAAKLAGGAAASNLGGYVSALEGSTGSLSLANFGVFGRSIASNGYQKLPGGLIIQWGWRGNGGVGFYWQTFPVTFPNACFGLVVSIVRSSAMGDYRAWYGQNTTGAYIATDQGDTFYIAVGY